MKLSEHFDLIEFVRSGTAARLGIDNTPSPEVVENLRRLSATLEEVRKLTGRALFVQSGYRCPDLNKAVGGSPHSYHMLGLAADFDPPPGMTHDELQHAIGNSGIVFDLCLEEQAKDGAHWLHLQIPKSGEPARRMLKDAALDHLGGAITRVSAG